MKINETTRKDGLRIISCYLPQKRSILVELISRVGYAYDPPGKAGLFHFFEHMAFKGTKKRSAKDLQAFSSKNFLMANAETSVLHTAYKVLVIDRKLPLACDYLCDIYCNSVFPSTELNKEKRPILLEIARHHDSDSGTGTRALLSCLYKENPLRLFGAGTSAEVKKIKRSDLIEQKQKWYVPSNTIALAVGNVRHADFAKKIYKRIPLKFQKVSLQKWSDEADTAPFKKEEIIRRPKRNKTILLIGRKIPIENNVKLEMKTNEVLSFLGKIMGMRPGSRLWNEIREKRGLAYSINSAYMGTPGLGRGFLVSTEVDHTKLDYVGKLIWRALLKPLTDKKEFSELRDTILDVFEIISVEKKEVDHYENLIMKQILEGKPIQNVKDEYRRRIEILRSLSLKDVEVVRRKYMRPEYFARVVVEPE